MKKTLTINLNQNLFNIDEDAYQKLSDYLNSIKKHFAKTQDSEEIISDIEARIAEKFFEKISASKSVVIMSDVEEIISSMGTVADLTREEKEEENMEFSDSDSDNHSSPKKLFRNPDDKVIGGVASGLATYFGLDTIFVRLAFIILAIIPFTSGISIITYIVLLFIAPEAKNAADRLQMKGETVTLSKIETMVNSKLSESKDKESRLSRLVLLPFRVLGRILPVLSRIISSIVLAFSSFIGFCLIIGIALAIGGLVFVLVQALVNGNILMGDLSFLHSIPSPQIQIILISTFFVAIFPLIFILQLGVTLLKRRSAFTLVNSLTNLFLWIIAIIIFSAAAVNVSPQIGSHFDFSQLSTNYVFPSVDQTNSQAISVSDFDKIEASSVYELVVNQSPEFSVTAFGASQYLSKLDIKTDSGTLKIHKRNFDNVCFGFCDNRLPIKIVVSAPNLSLIQASGLTKIVSQDLTLDQLAFKLSGASDVTLSGSINNLLFDLSGASKVNCPGLFSKSIQIKSSGASYISLTGLSDHLSVNTSGASKIETQNLEVSSVDLNSSGASSIKVNATQSLKIKASGASKILYSGSPQITQDLSGASSVKPIAI